MMTKIFLLLILNVASYAVFSQDELNQKDDSGYKHTHGEEVNDFIAPYLHSFCKQENISCDSLVKLFLEDSLRNRKYSLSYALISSIKYVTGDWTYFGASTPLIYQMAKIDTGKFVILYSKLHPQLILEGKKSEWRVAIVDNMLKVICEEPFITPWKYSEEGLWDMIYTDIQINKENISISIDYTHTGGGGGRDQEFSIKTTFINNKFSKISVEQIGDDY